MEAGESILKAVQEGQLDQVRKLVRQEPELIGYTTSSGIPVSLLAAYYQQWPIFWWMMSERGTPNVYEAAAGGMETPMWSLLTENPALVNAFAPDGFTPLGLACYFNRFSVAELLIARGADVNLPANNKARVAPLHSAVAAGSIEITHLLLEHEAEVNAVQHGGITALHSAAHRGNVEMVQLLLQYGAKPGLQTDDGRSALDFAQADGHEVVARLLS